MTKKILFIVASNGFQPIEYGVPRQILENENIKVVTASNAKDEDSNAISSDGSKVKVDLLLDNVKIEDYDGIFIIGGPGAMENLDHERTYRIIQEIDKSLNKIYGAICISTRILANADVLDGRKVTGWNDDKKLKEILDEVGAEYIAEGVIVDRNLITAVGPKHAQEFGQAILQALYPRNIEKPYEPPF
jgi:protease I